MRGGSLATANDLCQVVAVGGAVAETGGSTLPGRLRRLLGHLDSLLAERLEGTLPLLCRNLGGRATMATCVPQRICRSDGSSYPW